MKFFNRPYDESEESSSEFNGVLGRLENDDEDDDSAFDAVDPQKAKKPRRNYSSTYFTGRSLIDKENDLDAVVDLSLYV